MQLRKIMLIAMVFICCVGIDQATKIVVRAEISVGVSYSWLHDTVRLTHAENSGAFLSLGGQLPESVRRTLFSTVALLVSLVALIAALLMRDISRNQVIGLTLISAGGFANWIDRVTNDGHVTDFMNVGIGWLRTGIFNVADMALMVGIGLFIFAAQKTPENR
ncbi:MAG TPA: signal peptidase II [Steroidobacteraceae bacterium]|nr:signal peptidase II [Steroidobacteraceae bacterium]